jgi:hypothetical protein
MTSEKYGIGFMALRDDYDYWTDLAYERLMEIESSGSQEEVEAATIEFVCRMEAKEQWEEEWDKGNELGFDYHHDNLRQAAMEKLYPTLGPKDEHRETIYVDRTFHDSRSLVGPCFSTVNDELISHLSRHPDLLQQLHWRTFEILLADIFRNQGFDIELGPGRGDGGIDIRLIRKDSVGELLTLVQAKRYKHEHKIKLEAVAALSAIVDANQAHRGLFVTTSEFLPSARQFAKTSARRLELASSPEIVSWLKMYKKRSQ